MGGWVGLDSLQIYQLRVRTPKTIVSTGKHSNAHFPYIMVSIPEDLFSKPNHLKPQYLS